MKPAPLDRPHSRSLVLWLAILVGQTLHLSSAFGAISVGPAGTLVTFDSQPAINDGWSSAELPGTSYDIRSPDQMDAAVERMTSEIITNAVGSIDLVNDLALWSSSNRRIQTRPRYTAATLLMARFSNDTAYDLLSFDFSYNFGVTTHQSGTLIEEIPGYRVYYSLSGTSNSWIFLPEGSLSNATNRAGGTVELDPPWVADSPLYILWVDDNAVAGDFEGRYSVDDVSLIPREGQVLALEILQQPAPQTVLEGDPVTFTVSASGTGLHYQWLQDGFSIVGATNKTLLLPHVHLTDAGTYFVRVFNSRDEVQSVKVDLVVTPDTDPPLILGALSLKDGVHLLVSFNERIDGQSFTPYSFTLYTTPGAAPLEVMDAIVINSTNVLLMTEQREPQANYDLLVDSSVTDTQGNSIDLTNVPVSTEVMLLAIENTPWKYNHEGIDLGTAWRTDPNYNDRTWSNGVSLFDGKTPTNRPSVAGVSVATSLPLHFGPFVVDALPAYYFRTYFHLPTIPSEVAELRLRTVVDDFDVMWMNGHEAPVHINGGYTNSDADRFDYAGGPGVETAALLPLDGFIQIDPTNLLFGNNLVAVKLFQESASSSDITFAYELTAIVKRFIIPASRLSIELDPANPLQVIIQWNDSLGTLHEASEIAAPAEAWTLTPGASGNKYVVPATGVSKFYMIR